MSRSASDERVQVEEVSIEGKKASLNSKLVRHCDNTKPNMNDDDDDDNKQSGLVTYHNKTRSAHWRC